MTLENITIKIAAFSLVFFSAPLFGQGEICPSDCSLDEVERFLLRGDACYNCLNRRLNLTPLPGGCNGAVYLDTLAPARGSLNLITGFRLPLQLNFGNLEDGREGLSFLFVSEIDSLIVGQGGGYMSYETVNKSIGFVFDVHQNTEAPFNETENYDNFRLVSGGMLGDLLYGPISIKATHQDGFEQVEDGQNVNALITYDAKLHLLELHVDRFHRMTYRIDLAAFFGTDRIYAAALSCNDDVNSVNYSIGISDNNVLFNGNSRDLPDCEGNGSWLNWVHRSPPDNNSWNIQGLGLDQLIQERPGLPGMLGTHFPLIEAEASIYITPRPNTLLPDGTLVANTRQGSFGIGVGFRAPYAQFQDNFDGILLDWSQAASLGNSPKPEGIFLSRLLGPVAPGEHDDDTHPLVTREENNGYSILDAMLQPSWELGATYEFKVRYTSNRLYAEIIDTTTATIVYNYDGKHSGDPGSFVVYNYHQPGILYQGFNYRLLHEFTMDRDTICPGESVQIEYDAAATPKLTEVAQNIFWLVNNEERFNAFSNGKAVMPLHYDFTDCGDQTISLVVVDSSGCFHPFTRTLHVREVSKIRLGPDRMLCSGQTAVLIPEINSDTVLWQDGSLSPMWEVNEPGEYIAISLDSLTCPVRDTINVAYFPPLNYDLRINPDCPRGEEGQIEVIPIPENNPLSAILNDQPGLFHSDLIAGNYLLEVIDTNNCTTGDLMIEVGRGVSSVPTISIIAPLCASSASGSIVVMNEEGITTSLEGVVDTAFNNLPAGNYPILFEDSLGCLQEEVVTIEEPTALQLLGLRDTTIIRGQTINLSPILSFGEADSVTWIVGDSLIQTDNITLLAMPETNTRYSVRVINRLGCQAEASILVNVNDEGSLYIPTAFSPNFDGFNDYFYPMGGRVTPGVREIQLTIYNRFGGVIFETAPGALPDDPAYGWDGTVKGRPVNPGSYAYSLKISWMNGQTEVKKGTIQLMR